MPNWPFLEFEGELLTILSAVVGMIFSLKERLKPDELELERSTWFDSISRAWMACMTKSPCDRLFAPYILLPNFSLQWGDQRQTEEFPDFNTLHNYVVTNDWFQVWQSIGLTCVQFVLEVPSFGDQKSCPESWLKFDESLCHWGNLLHCLGTFGEVIMKCSVISTSINPVELSHASAYPLYWPTFLIFYVCSN